MASEQQHVEVVVSLRPGADSRAVAKWLAEHGLRVTPLTAGLLVTGDAADIKTAFDADQLDALRVPGALRPHVESVATAPQRRLLEGRD